MAFYIGKGKDMERCPVMSCTGYFHLMPISPIQTFLTSEFMSMVKIWSDSGLASIRSSKVLICATRMYYRIILSMCYQTVWLCLNERYLNHLTVC